MADSLENSFNLASKHFPSLVSSLPNEKLLYFYSRYKQATEGNCNISKPGLFDQSGRRKWEAWKKLEGTSKVTAMTEYIEGVQDLDPEWSDSNTTDSSASWARVSRMPQPDKEECTTFLDAIQTGSIGYLAKFDLKREALQTFDDGMTALHWAADRGHVDVAKLLLDNSADVNARDECGQTPLHYAASCGHEAIVKILLQHGADSTLQDSDQLTPEQVTDDPTIKQLFND